MSIRAVRKADGNADVVVASVATLGRRNTKRLERLDPDQFYLLVVDEAHHATADTYRRVLDHFGVLVADTRKLVAGFTATPKRGDNQGLSAVFQEIVFSRNLPEMIETGYLSPVAAYRVETDVDLSRVRTRLGDFVTGQLSAAVNIDERNEIVIDVFRKHLSDRRTLIFCVDVAHTEDLAAGFRRAGIEAAAVTGKTPGEERRTALDAFSRHRADSLALVSMTRPLAPHTGLLAAAQGHQSAREHQQGPGQSSHRHALPSARGEPWQKMTIAANLGTNLQFTACRVPTHSVSSSCLASLAILPKLCPRVLRSVCFPIRSTVPDALCSFLICVTAANSQISRRSARLHLARPWVSERILCRYECDSHKHQLNY